MTFSVATFNCNSVRQRLPAILDWLDAHDPDVLALQETKVQDHQFPVAELEAKGWHASFRGEKSYNGVAMLTREPPKEVSFGMDDGDGGESETRLVAIRHKGHHVVNTYVPQGRALDSPKFEAKLEWLRRLRVYLKKRYNFSRQKVIWVGDLNVAPQPMDVYNSKKIWPHVCHCQQVWDTFERVTALGFRDVFRKHLPEPGVYTFWDYRVRDALGRGMGWRIDHVLASPSAAKRSKDCIVDVEPRKADKPSDHTFVLATFE